MCKLLLFIDDMYSVGVSFVTGFMKADPSCTFGILRIASLKYLTHCESLLLGCNHTIFTL